MTIISTKEEMEKLMADVLPELKDIALAELRRRVDKYNLKLTDELYGSFRAAVLSAASAARQEILISFSLYGRYKDLRFVEYSEAFRPPGNTGKMYKGTGGDTPELVEAMQDFIKKAGGIGKFGYVPGYYKGTAKRMPVNSRAITRLAWTLAIDRLKKSRLKNRRRGWYNEARGAIIGKGTVILKNRVGELMVKQLLAQAQGEIHII